jgi:uncharacterized protein
VKGVFPQEDCITDLIAKLSNHEAIDTFAGVSIDTMSDFRKDPFPPLELLKQVFDKYDEIEAVYLFGSAAKGAIHPESDLDIGIVAGDPSLCQRKLDILTDLAKIGFCSVDLVFLDTKDIVMRFEVVKHNRVIYQKSGFDRCEMFSRTLRMYFDFLPHLRIQREYFKRRVLSGQHSNNAQKDSQVKRVFEHS